MDRDQYVIFEKRLAECREQAEANEKSKESFARAMLKIARLHDRGAVSEGQYLELAGILLDALRLAEAQVTVEYGIRLSGLALQSVRLRNEALYQQLREIMET